jgi:hypothetical protein
MVESSSRGEVKFYEMGAGFPPVISRCIFSRFCHFLGKRLWSRIFILDPFDGAKPRLSKWGRKAPLRVNPEPVNWI